MENKLLSLPLKELDSAGLTLVVLEEALHRFRPIDHSKIHEAVNVATFLHRKQTRAVRKNLPRTPYIEHPLRNSLRLMRWEATNPALIIAAVLHDTVEDCLNEILTKYVGMTGVYDDVEMNRAIALEWIEEIFGREVSFIVSKMTNPLEPAGDRSLSQKHVDYAAHVKEVIIVSVYVYLCKLADFVDNATGLYHNASLDANNKMTSTNPVDVRNNKMAKRLATKYRPVCDIFIDNMPDDLPISLEGRQDIIEKLEFTKSRLDMLIAA